MTYHADFSTQKDHFAVVPNPWINISIQLALKNNLKREDYSLFISDVWRNTEEFYRNLGWSPPEATLLRKNIKG